MLNLSCVAETAHIVHRGEFIQESAMKNRTSKAYFSVFRSKSGAAASLNEQATCMFVLAPHIAGDQRNKGSA